MTMDILDRVRDIEQEAELSEAQVARARHVLSSEIAGRPVARAAAGRLRRPWVRAGVLAGSAAAVAAAVFVAGNLLPVDPGDPGKPPVIGPGVATAAEVLEQTAQRAIAVDAGIQPGQYLRIEETQAFLEFAIEDVATGELVPMGNRENAEAAFVAERTTQLYVPADREDEWVWDLRGPWEVTEVFGDRAEEAVAFWERQSHGDTPEVWRLPGGRDPAGEGGAATLDNREELASMPRDPEELLEWYRHRPQAPGEGADGWIVWTISSTLTTNLAPADLRAAMFEALALVEGVEIAEQAGEIVAFSYTAVFGDWTRTTTFTVDTELALVTAVTDASIPSGGSIVPDSVPDERRSVVVSAVDEAP